MYATGRIERSVRLSQGLPPAAGIVGSAINLPLSFVQLAQQPSPATGLGAAGAVSGAVGTGFAVFAPTAIVPGTATEVGLGVAAEGTAATVGGISVATAATGVGIALAAVAAILMFSGLLGGPDYDAIRAASRGAQANSVAGPAWTLLDGANSPEALAAAFHAPIPGGTLGPVLAGLASLIEPGRGLWIPPFYVAMRFLDRVGAQVVQDYTGSLGMVAQGTFNLGRGTEVGGGVNSLVELAVNTGPGAPASGAIWWRNVINMVAGKIAAWFPTLAQAAAQKVAKRRPAAWSTVSALSIAALRAVQGAAVDPDWIATLQAAARANPIPSGEKGGPGSAGVNLPAAMAVLRSAVPIFVRALAPGVLTGSHGFGPVFVGGRAGTITPTWSPDRTEMFSQIVLWVTGMTDPGGVASGTPVTLAAPVPGVPALAVAGTQPATLGVAAAVSGAGPSRVAIGLGLGAAIALLGAAML